MRRAGRAPEFSLKTLTHATRTKPPRMLAVKGKWARWLLVLLLALGWHAHGAEDEVEPKEVESKLKEPKVVEPDTRIVGGQPTTIAQVPYIVQIRYDGQFSCGGTLVSRRHVVTAAHCVQGRTIGRFVVTAGATRLTDTGVRSRVTRAYYPSNFNMQTFNHDVAVLRLARRLTGTNVRPIRLCNSRMRVNSMVRISGWGYTSETANQPSYRLRTVSVPIISDRSCRRSYRGTMTIGASMFCAGVPGRRDSCSGDSGGPLIYRGRLCGIVSFGVGCAERRFPGVYTSVNNVKRFIVRSVQRR